MMVKVYKIVCQSHRPKGNAEAGTARSNNNRRYSSSSNSETLHGVHEVATTYLHFEYILTQY